MINTFAKDVLLKSCPKHICAGDDRCLSLLRDLCAKAGITLTREHDLPLLEAFKRGLVNRSDEAKEGEEEEAEPEDLEELFDTLMRMGDRELRQIPPSLADLLLNGTDPGVVPDELTNRLRRLFR